MLYNLDFWAKRKNKLIQLKKIHSLRVNIFQQLSKIEMFLLKIQKYSLFALDNCTLFRQQDYNYWNNRMNFLKLNNWSFSTYHSIKEFQKNANSQCLYIYQLIIVSISENVSVNKQLKTQLINCTYTQQFAL